MNRPEEPADTQITAGVLYVVATPIGNLDDISVRAAEILRQVDLIAAEDTRHSAILLKHLSVDTSMMALHDFNERDKVEEVLGLLGRGRDVALISDAGTPLISDPGYRLVSQAREMGIRVSPVPGPCALIAALSASGLPCDSFVFEGFPPAKAAGRLALFQSLARETRTLIFYEAPHRILACLADMREAFGAGRYVVLARELSKTYESIYGDVLEKLEDWINRDENRQRGEIVVLVHGAEQPDTTMDQHTTDVLMTLMDELPLKQAVALAARITGRKKNLLYQRALQLRAESGN